MKNIILPDKVYAALKWLCLIAMPALSFGYAKLAPIWNLPFAEQIPETIGVVSFVIGCLIGVSHINYYKEEEPKEEPKIEE